MSDPFSLPQHVESNKQAISDGKKIPAGLVLGNPSSDEKV